MFLRTDATLPPFYILVYIDDLVFATADIEALAHVKSELQKRHTCTDLGELTSYLGLRITRDRAQRTITLTQSHMVQQVLQRFGFTYSSPQSTPLPTGHSLSAPPLDESVEPSGPYPELVGCLMYLMTCTRPDLAYPLSLLARYVAPDRHRKRSSQGYTFSLGSSSVSWRSTRSSSVLSSSCEAEIYAGAMAAQELRWLTYMLTDLGEVPRSPPVLYVDNKAMLAARSRAVRAARRLSAGRAGRRAGRAGQGRTGLESWFLQLSSSSSHPPPFPPPHCREFLPTRSSRCSSWKSLMRSESTFLHEELVLPDPLRAVKDHFLALDPTDLTVDLLEKHLLAAETSVVAKGAARGTPRTTFFEGCYPSPLAPSYASATAVDILGAEDVGVASSLSGKHRSSKGKGGKSGGGGSGGGGGGRSGGSGGGGGVGNGGSGGGSGGFGGGGGGSCGGGGGGGGGSGSGGRGSGGGWGGVVQWGGSGGGQRQQQERRSETSTPEQLHEWSAQRGAFGGSVRCPYVIRKVMYALSVIAEGDCYLYVPPDPDIEATALAPSESALHGTAPAKALHTFTLDYGASRCFFRDSTTLTPLPVQLADPLGGAVPARSSTVLPCLAVPSGSLSGLHLPSFSMNLVTTAALQDAMVTTTTPRGQRVLICSCTRTGRHLATFTCRPPQVAASAQVSASSPVAATCLCRLLSHQTLLWHHRFGHPSLPRLRGMQSRLLVSGLPRSLPPLSPSPASPCLHCIEGRQRAAPHSSSFPPTTTPLQTLHMDVWGPARVSGQGRERYFLLVVDDYMRYTTVFPLRSKGEVFDVLIPWIRAVRLQLRERFREDLPVLRLHSDRGVMEVARTSMIDAAAPHFLWPFVVRYAAHQLELFPHVSLPETSPTLRWTGKVGDVSVFRGPAPSGVSQVDPLPLAVPVEVAVDSGSARGAASGGAASRGDASGGAEPASAELGGAEPKGTEPAGAEPKGTEPRGAKSEGAEPGGTEPEGAKLGGAESKGAESGGAEPRGTTSAGGPASSSPRLSHRREPLSPQQLREWFAQRTLVSSGVARAGGSAAGGTGAGGAGAGDPGARGPGARGARVGGPGAGGTMQRHLFFVPPQQSSLPPPDSPDSPLPAPPYAEQTKSLTEHREPESRPASPVRAVRTGRHVPRPRPPPEPGTHTMALHPSSVPLRVPLPSPPASSLPNIPDPDLRVPLPSPPASSLPNIPDPESDLARAASPTVPHLLATIVTNPSFESTVVSALVAELVDFAAAYRLDYAASLVAESESDYPPSVGGGCAFGTDDLEDRQEEFECLAAAVPHLVAMLLALEGDPDAPDFPTPRSYTEAIMGPYSSQTTLAALGFAPSSADPSLFLRTDTSLPPFYVLVYVDDLVFATADTEALAIVKFELQKRHTCTDLGELRSHLGLQITRDRARRTITLTQSHMVHQVLQHFRFCYSSPQSTPLPTGHSLSAPPSDESVEPSGPHRPEHWEATKRVLHHLCSTLGMGLVLGGRGLVVLTGHADASWVDDLAMRRSSQGYNCQNPNH
ncbi:unnamed protein product [Closterium sp. NIES-54]